jgi:hypothetical protein
MYEMAMSGTNWRGSFSVVWPDCDADDYEWSEQYYT